MGNLSAWQKRQNTVVCSRVAREGSRMKFPDDPSEGSYPFCGEKKRALILAQRQSSKLENRVFSLVQIGSPPNDPKPITEGRGTGRE